MKIDKLVRYAAGLGLIGALTFACTGTLQLDDPPGGPLPDAAPDAPVEPATAKDYYNQYVAPIVGAGGGQQNQCSCHTAGVGQNPVFVGDTTDATYDYLKAGYPDGEVVKGDYAVSPFYTAPQDDHYGAGWQGGEADYVKEWLTREYDEYNNPGSPAETQFLTYIEPLLVKCAACHGNSQAPVFVKGSPQETYDYLKADYPGELVGTAAAQSTLYTEAYPDEHFGATWSGDEATAISDWIDAEYAEYSANQ